MLTHRATAWENVWGRQTDKWALYAIAQYCDQTVPDGFTDADDLNAYLSQQRRRDVLSDFCSAMLYAGMEQPDADVRSTARRMWW
ncbi:hypothetical protein OHD13_16640 [Escherichia coli]|nr:hypothetical protein [Escherichia coli]MCW7229615.1 hypothetical protein [Escherichia coli]